MDIKLSPDTEKRLYGASRIIGGSIPYRLPRRALLRSPRG